MSKFFFINWKINIPFFNDQNSIPEAMEYFIFYNATEQIHQSNNIFVGQIGQ